LTIPEWFVNILTSQDNILFTERIVINKLTISDSS
jgi:hypothetical protein